MIELIFLLLSFFVYHRVNDLLGVVYRIFMLSVLGIYLLMRVFDDLVVHFYYFYIDGIGINLVILRLWIRILMILSRFKVFLDNNYGNLFSLLIYVLRLVLTVTFLVGDYLMFYLFFEISIVPTLLIIIGWGYQPERLQAGVYFIFYTLTASLPLLVVILFFIGSFSQTSFIVESLDLLTNKGGVWWYLFGLIGSMAFLVKLPIYFVHL